MFHLVYIYKICNKQLQVPPELPEPALGINFARDGMKRSDWLSLVAVHSDSWLMAIACFNGARLDRDGRRQLFNSINALQTCYEIVSGKASYSGAEGNMNESNFPTAKRGRGANDNEGNGTTASQKRQKVPQNQESEADSDEGEQEDEDEEDDDAREWVDNSGDPCPNCGRLYRTGEFWIQCDDCDRWFDGKCVNMTQQKAERTRDWKCPFCARGH